MADVHRRAGGGTLGPGPRTTVRRLAARAHYDRAAIHRILDEGFVCHLGTASGGHAKVLPMVFGRSGDALYLHGAPANDVLQGAAREDHACLSVTLVDALVLARSAFHHSVNYRSVVAFGPVSEVTDLDEQREGARAIVDHVLPGRSREARPPTDRELRATRLVRFDIVEASAKIRSGGPTEEPGDLVPGAVWAGIVPLTLTTGAPVRDTQAPVGAALPGAIRRFVRPGIA